jgi:hypothetical protein
MIPIKILAAAKSLSEHWFPVNPVVHDQIVTRMRKGFYNKDLTPLVADVMSDPALFGHCLRKLFELARDGEIPACAPFDFSSLFKSAGLATLKNLIDRPVESLSPHNLDDLNEPRANCLHQMLLSASCAEVLSEKAKFPRAAGFAGAFMRQLGLTLIVWNYPHVFRQALWGVKRGETLDQALHALLGYSPRMLSLVLAKEWGLSGELLYAMGDKDVLPESGDPGRDKVRVAAEVLLKSCEVGEVLAQASHPESYPKAFKRWEDAKQSIEGALGPYGLRLIETRLRSSLQSYMQAHSRALERLIKLPLGGVGESQDGAAEAGIANNLEQDTGESGSPVALREKLAVFYKGLAPGRPSKENVLVFAEELVPCAGFSGGCIFMYDFECSQLMARYRFGACSLGNEKIPCSPLLPTINPIAEAFRSDRPVFEHNPWHERETSYVAQAFGSIQRVGVQYLEIGRELNEVSNSELLKLYRALRQALQDCLGVR